MEHSQPSESETAKLLEKNYQAIKDLYQKKDSPYDHKYELEEFVKSGFLGAFYWDYNSMLSDIAEQIEKLKKKDDFILQVLIKTLTHPKSSLSDIISGKIGEKEEF